jgi:hypothetical protein
MSTREKYLYDRLFEGAGYFDCNNILHIGTTTSVKIGQNVAHPLCGRRLRKWIGFNDLMYAKSSCYCDTCFLLYAITKLANKVALNNRKETKGEKE